MQNEETKSDEVTRAAVPGVKQMLGTCELSSYVPMAAMWGKDQADARESRWQIQDEVE